ncbi:hypothetical protein PENFLA_c023G00454 [Penicillium flavigenum]|uniref:Uncharacterized protein n=1 Tax=Penicillium flavigenum TaxID=254877 RepID=A0A1V6SUN0_9EURO|nr:hypothetical protein PENFLA_c023G00454 [Penicillium flavigenum]
MSETSIATQPKSPSIDLFGPPAQRDIEVTNSVAPDMSTPYDSYSDIQTVILCDSPSENDTSMLQSSSSDQKEPSTISNTSSDDPDNDFSDSSSGDSSWTVPDSSSGAKSESSSIDSFGTSSQQDFESEEEEQPRGSQNLAAYASAIRDGKRIRTSCDSVDDPGRWHVDSDGFINEKYRAGGPFLCSLPKTILTLKGSPPLYTVLETISLHKMIFSVLEYKVNASSVTIKKCQYEFWPIIEPLPTLIITATRDTFSDAWVQACRKIWRHLSENQLGHINVEISDPALHHQFRAWPQDSKHPIYPIQRDVMRRIRTEVDLTGWVDFGVSCIGTTPDVKDSEMVMLLNVHFKSDRDWRAPRDQIISILENFKLPMVGVLIQKSKPLSLGHPGRWERPRSPEDPDVVAAMTW